MNSSHNIGDLILVIDMQNVYLPGQPWACPRMPQASENICRILQTVRHKASGSGAVGHSTASNGVGRDIVRNDIAYSSAAQVLFTRFLAPENPVGTWRNYNKANQRVNEDAWMNALASPFAVNEEDRTVTLDAACSGTTYPLYSKSTYSALTVPAIREAALRCGRLVLTGVVADCCVLWTAMEAIDLGIPVVYITDAVAGIDDESEAAADRVVRGLSPAQTTLLTTSEYLQSLQ